MSSNAPKLNFIASGDIGRSRFVTLDSSNDFQVNESNANEMPIGVSQEWQNDSPSTGESTEAAQANDPIAVYSTGQICRLSCATTISNGDLLRPDAEGEALVASAGQKYGAVALEAGVDGDLIRVLVQPGELET